MENKGLQIASGVDTEAQEVEIIGIHTLCRLCASQNERLISIFGEEGITNDLSNKINLYLPIKVAATDVLPLQCCWNCASTLLAWHELVLTSVEIDRKFRNSQFIAEKVDEGGYDNSTNPFSASDDNEVCDNEGTEPKCITTSLNDFSPDPKRPTSPHRTKKPAPFPKSSPPPCLPLPEPPSLDSYISDIEQQLIDPELVDNPEYKLDVAAPDSDDDAKADAEEERPYFGCQFCPAIFFSRRSAAEHAREAHGGGSAAAEKKERRKHNKIDPELVGAAKVVVEGRVYYHCNECGKNLHSPYTYTWHMRIHTGERPYVCDLCGKQFRVSQGLVRHLRETHEGIKKFPCDLCGRMFATRRNVEEHRRIHTNERPYVCDLCGKAFKQKASLFVHKRSHRNHFPFKCSYCNQGFRTKPPLLVHITRHTGEKPYKCDVCGRCFRIKYELKRHRLIHSDEKPWVCGICGFSFRQKRYLRNHTKSNHAVLA